MDLPRTARAAVVAEYAKPIEIRELPVPRPEQLEPGARRRAGPRYDFEAMLTTRYPLEGMNAAIPSLRAFREIKPLVLPWASH